MEQRAQALVALTHLIGGLLLRLGLGPELQVAPLLNQWQVKSPGQRREEPSSIQWQPGRSFLSREVEPLA
jgi:hypothetical protein